MTEEKRVILMLNDIDDGVESIGHISVPESKAEDFRKALLDHDIGATRVSVETVDSVEELSYYLDEDAGHDMDRCNKHHMHNCPDCHPMPEDAEER